MQGKNLYRLLNEFHGVLASYPLQNLQKLLSQIEYPLEQNRAHQPSNISSLDQLTGFLKHVDKKFNAFSQSLAEKISDLCWFQSYSESDVGKAFVASYGYSELIGTRGPVINANVAAGVFFIGPNLIYPSHSHEAEEFYLPLTPGTLFRHDQQPWEEIRPGGSFYNQCTCINSHGQLLVNL